MKRLLLALIFAALWCAPAQGADSWSAINLSATKVSIEAGHSRIVNLPRPVKRVSVGNSKVADVVVIKPTQIYVNAQKVGSTNISLWDRKNFLMGAFVVDVVRDISSLKERIHQIAPREQVEVREMDGAVVISGMVTSPVVKKRIEAVAKTFDEKRITSLLEVAKNNTQVMLKVSFAEVKRSASNRLNVGIGFFNSAGQFFNTFMQGLYTPYETTIGLDSFGTKLQFSDALSSIWGFSVGQNRFTFFLDALKSRGLAKVLAEPNLVAASGQKATFLAGGEFPVPIPQKDSVTIKFKKFGVQLTFKPEVLDDGNIKLEVEPVVSDLDFSTAVRIEGYVVPGLTTRSAKTELHLKDGQDFAIAGLFRDEITHEVAKIPLLGSLPILGPLFRSNQFQRKETELVIVVTPHIIKPGMGKPGRLPTDGFKIPSSYESFLFGKITERAAGKGEMQFRPQPGLDSRQERPAPAPAEPAAPAVPSSVAPAIPATPTMGLPRSLSLMEGKFGHAWDY